MKRVLTLLLAAVQLCAAALAATAPEEHEIIEFARLIAAAPCVEVDLTGAWWDDVSADDALERCDALAADDDGELIFACAFRYDHRVMSIITAAWRPEGEWLGADAVAQAIDPQAQEALCLQCRGWVELVCPGAVAAAPDARVLDLQLMDGQPCWLVAFYDDAPENGAAPCVQAAVQLMPDFRVLMLERAWRE